MSSSEIAIYTYSTETVPVSVSISVNKTKVAVGETVRISGKVTADGQAVSGMKVTLYVNGKAQSSTTTASDGSFYFDISFNTVGEFKVKVVAEKSSVTKTTEATSGGGTTTKLGEVVMK